MNNQPSTVPTDAEREQELAAIEKVRQQKLTTFSRTFEFQAERKQRAEEKFIESVTNHGLLYAMEWGRQEAETIAQAELWEGVKRLYDQGVDEDQRGTLQGAVLALTVIRDEVQKQLLHNWVRKSSTDEFSNAVSGAKANAFARFHGEATGLIQFLTGE